MPFDDTMGGPTSGGGKGDSGRAGGEGTVGDRDPGNEKQGQDPTGSPVVNLDSPQEKGSEPTPGMTVGDAQRDEDRQRETAAGQPRQADDIGSSIGGAGAGSDLGGTTDLPPESSQR